MSTAENLSQAFACECQANRKYLAYARKADTEGFPNIAKRFRMAAEAEAIHAMIHLRAMGGVGTTLENLKKAIEGEELEANHTYPEFTATAEKDGNRVAAAGFRNAWAVEKVHYKMFMRALKALESGADLPPATSMICESCGNPIETPVACPICGQLKRIAAC